MRVLVTAASRHGSTAEIATELGKTLRGALPGAGVDVVPLSRVASFTDYDAVVLGSAVYFGRWLDEARWQVSAHPEALRQQLVWLFSSGPVGDSSVPAAEPADAIELAVAIGAREHVLFPGALHRELLGVRERLAVGMVGAIDGDYRDWPAVRAWADRIAGELRVVRGTGAVEGGTAPASVDSFACEAAASPEGSAPCPCLIRRSSAVT